MWAEGHHWICLIDGAGTTVWSAKVVNDEGTILDVIDGVLARADEVVWGVDVTCTMPACCSRCCRRTVSG